MAELSVWIFLVCCIGYTAEWSVRCFYCEEESQCAQEIQGIILCNGPDACLTVTDLEKSRVIYKGCEHSSSVENKACNGYGNLEGCTFVCTLFSFCNHMRLNESVDATRPPPPPTTSTTDSITNSKASVTVANVMLIMMSTILSVISAI